MFDLELSSSYNIHRTRVGFNKPIDDFESMAEKGLLIIDKVVKRKYNGVVKNNMWIFYKSPTRYTSDFVDEKPEIDSPPPE